MAHVILGLLLIAPQSLYGLIKSFEAGVSLFYSASSGSIKRALDGLLARDLIEVASVEAGARGKKIYRVTDAGRGEFRAWMTGELAGANPETAALARFYFLGLLEPADRGPALEKVLTRVESDLARLQALDEQLDSMEIPPEYHDVAVHQRATLDYGLASSRFLLDWFRRYLDEL